jgi:hypothetical protein
LKENKSSEYKIAVFGAVIGIILTAIYDFIKEKPILSSLWNILKWIWVNVFEFTVSIWQIILVLIIIYFIKKLKPKKEKEIPKFLKYVSDEFDEITWKWKWEWNPLTQQWNVQNLIPQCNKCGTSAILNESYVDKYATCPRCENFMNELKSTEKIEAIIIDNIDRELYLNKK